jgi:hypothetical protein
MRESNVRLALAAMLFAAMDAPARAANSYIINNGVCP